MSYIRILAVDSSTMPASAAVVEDGKILAEFFLNTKLTHSQTLLPMVKAVLDITQTVEPDLIAVTTGPGSFTGVRIGISAVKGIAFTNQIPCVGLSVLETLAYNYSGVGEDCTVLAAVDARCGQAYAAFFKIEGGSVLRTTEDKVIQIEVLCEQAMTVAGRLVLVGDCAYALRQLLPQALLAPENIRYQRASAAAFAAVAKKWCTGAQLQPIYLQLPQAQRELNQRMKEKEQ